MADLIKEKNMRKWALTTQLRLKKCRNISKKIFSGDGPPAPPAHTGGTAKIHPKLSSFINYIQVDCVLWSWIPTIPVLNPRRNANILYCLSPQSVHFAGFDAAAEKDLTYQVNIFDTFSKVSMSCESYSGGNCHKIFSNQMSSFSENAALGYLKSQVCTW